jgi:hypothetical protein
MSTQPNPRRPETPHETAIRVKNEKSAKRAGIVFLLIVAVIVGAIVNACSGGSSSSGSSTPSSPTDTSKDSCTTQPWNVPGSAVKSVSMCQRPDGSYYFKNNY